MGIFNDDCEAEVTCDVPLYPGSWNVWLLARSMHDNPTSAQIHEELQRLFGRNLVQNVVRVSNWLPRTDATDLGIHTFLGHSKNPDDLTDHAALQIAEWKIAQKYQGTSSPVLVRDLAQCGHTGPAPRILGPKFTFVLVQFVWRGGELSVPWIGSRRYGYDLPGFPAAYSWSRCLNPATYLLTEVWRPLAAKEVPTNPSDTFLGQFGNGVEKLQKLGKIVKDSVVRAQIATQVIGAIGAAGLLYVVGRHYANGGRL